MSRRDIYYWKCDRPAAFHGTQTRGEADAEIESQLREALQRELDAKVVVLSPGAGQGNHLTWNAKVDGKAMFVRVENGPEKDVHLAVESVLLGCVKACDVPTPKVYACDATRARVQFAWQALERINVPDLNHWHKQGLLDVPHVAFEIGLAVAKWQGLRPLGFGPFDDTISGCHVAYADYFHLRLDTHLGFLVAHGFLSRVQSDEIIAEIENHHTLLQLERGCFVHKDLALWNILGTRDQIAAFIDFDDSIAGDPMDDLSLLACFHDDAFLQRAFQGYQSVRALPEHYVRRFWLHLLRNMIVKAVIRVGAGYFDRDDGFFLIGSGSSGSSLREMTLSRLALALRGLREGSGLDILSP